MKTLLTRLVVVMLLGSAAIASGAPLVSGTRLRVGGDGRGPLSAGLSNYPLGTAQVYGSGLPDLFVAAARFSHEPGLYLYRSTARDDDRVPVFGSRIRIVHPGDGEVPPTGTIFQARSGVIYGLWLIDNELVRTRFNLAQAAFVRMSLPPISIERVLPGPVQKNPDNRSAIRFTVLEQADGCLEVILSVSDGTPFRPPAPPGHRDPEFHPFNGRGIWKGGWPHVYLRTGRLPTIEADTGELEDVRDVSTTQREALLSHGNLTIVNLGPEHERDVLTGSHFGNFYHYSNRGEAGLDLAPVELVLDENARVLRSPIISASPLAYPDARDGEFRDLIVGGEGALFYLRQDGFAAGEPLSYRGPLDVREENALLYAGSLPVVNSVDWDGDGITDLVVGNSEGKILFFHNGGSDAEPDFALGQPLSAAGESIHIQSGYWSIQGPGESRWGYVSPTVVDWNDDGLPDILMSDATARHTVYLNLGSKTAPCLGVGRPLYCEGIDIHGTWRVRPAVTRWGGEMAYVALNGDDQFHVYWRIDDQNLSDGGKLMMEDGSPIQANFLDAGGTGRAKIVLADWDEDGAMDLLVGTPRHGSVPNPTEGLPQAKGLPGATVLWLRNTGTDAAPRFAFPRILHVAGQPVYLGQHECSVAVTSLGGEGGPHLLVGDEEGRVHFFHRQDVTWSE